MNLVIVESPAKAKTIKTFLGKAYYVVASKGHIRDLPKKSFGIKIEGNRVLAKYEESKDHKKEITELKKLAKDSDIIYIATDEDREGEAIGYHITQILGIDETTVPRIAFHEITKKAILEALKNPSKIDLNRVNAQQTRRFLDRIVGFKLSGLLSKKIESGLSGGRVQSATLKFITDREKERNEFKKEEYWTINSEFTNEIIAEIIEYKDKKLKKLDIKNEKMANEIKKAITDDGDILVLNIENKNRKTKPSAPLITSTLQQSASNLFGYKSKKTMQIAQKLYEGVNTNKGTMGVITYMRTDSFNLSSEFKEDVKKYVLDNFGKNYLPAKPNFYGKKAQAQEAHEAIRPTDISITPALAQSFLTSEEHKIYSIIYNRAVASQMSSAEFSIQNITFGNSTTKLKASGRKLLFDGFYAVLKTKSEDKLLPDIKLDEIMKIKKIDAKQQFTEPPPRYNEASIIKTMEAEGIGRPSTYSPTISTLTNRNYITIENKQLIPTENAFKVVEMLDEYFANIIDSNFTAKVEEKLDEISIDSSNWESFLVDFSNKFTKQLEDGDKNIKSQKIVEATGRICPSCGEELVIRGSKFGKFIACSGFPKCKYSESLDKDEDEKVDEKCDKCGGDMIIKHGRNGKFLACSNYPKCKNTKSLNGESNQAQEVDVECPLCKKAKLVLRSSRRGPFYGCSSYPKCKFTSKFLPTEKECPKCGFKMAKRTFRNKEIYECCNSECKERIDI